MQRRHQPIGFLPCLPSGETVGLSCTIACGCCPSESARAAPSRAFALPCARRRSIVGGSLDGGRATRVCRAEDIPHPRRGQCRLPLIVRHHSGLRSDTQRARPPARLPVTRVAQLKPIIWNATTCSEGAAGRERSGSPSCRSRLERRQRQYILLDRNQSGYRTCSSSADRPACPPLRPRAPCGCPGFGCD